MKNEYKMNKKKMISWTNTLFFYGIRRKIVFAMYAFLIVLQLYYGIKFWEWHLYWGFSGYCLLLFVFTLYMMIFRRYILCLKRYKFYVKTFGVEEWTNSIEFLEDEIILKDHSSVTTLKYLQIRKIREKGNMILIHFNNEMVLILYKDTFVDCTWDECKNLIETKISKK